MKVEFTEDACARVVHAPAKVNLFFEILGRRSDGYHEIATVVTPISLYDRLEFERDDDSREISLQCFDENGSPLSESFPCDRSNLVVKAYNKFWSMFNESAQFGARCKLYKRIPTQAGLGGGSSDATACLLALASLLDRSVRRYATRAFLQSVAAEIGSDCALFLENSGSIGRGRGELVEPIETPPLPLVLLKPREGLSTAETYKQYSSTNAAYARAPRRSLAEFCETVAKARDLCRVEPNGESLSARAIASAAFNRLEEPAGALWSGLENCRRRLLDSGAFQTLMSGSGTTVFGFYEDESAARRAFDYLNDSSETRERGDKIYCVRTL